MGYKFWLHIIVCFKVRSLNLCSFNSFLCIETKINHRAYQKKCFPTSINPLKHGGGALYAPPSLFLCLLLKISWDNPYLKILDLANLFVADVPMKKKKKIGPPPPQSTFKYRSKNRPWGRGLTYSPTLIKQGQTVHKLILGLKKIHLYK